MVATRKIPKGSILVETDFTMKRPGTGLHSKNIVKLVGKKALFDIEEDQIVSLEMFN